MPSAKDFIGAGWQRVLTTPPAAAQLSKEGYGYDIAENAAAALAGGAVAYRQSKCDPRSLREAALQVFHAVELVLKIKLEQLAPGTLVQRPNNPTVVQKLQAANILIRNEELEIINELRALRNHLQHSGALYTYREVRRVIRGLSYFWTASHSMNSVGGSAPLSTRLIGRSCLRLTQSGQTRRPEPGSPFKKCRGILRVYNLAASLGCSPYPGRPLPPYPDIRRTHGVFSSGRHGAAEKAPRYPQVRF